MKPRKEQRESVDSTKQPQTGKARFQIVKLEERIAPTHPHYNPHGKLVGAGADGGGGKYF